jgi:23S rRNA (cytosine1962-C5)-methyltransferase
VLDVFAYVGAFAVYCAHGGASHITSVDSSAPALAAAKQLYALNLRQGRIPQVPFETLTGDAFTLLKDMVRQRRHFDMVIIDPPSFASSESDVPGALRAYRQLAELGAQLLAPGGVFVMASCSSRVSEQQFFETILPAAAAHRPYLDEIARTYHALDHPIGFAEGAYLKCWFARDE